MASLPIGQEWIIQRMQALGYPSDPNGICFGIVHMAIQAILLDDIDTFNQRLQEIYALAPDEIASAIQKSRDKYKTQPTLSDPVLEISAFFDGVELYHRGWAHKEFFKKNATPLFQNAMLSAPLAISHDLKQKGGFIQAKASNFTGMYTKDELTDYFTTLVKAINDANPPLTQPFPLVLMSANHAVTISYYPAKKQWLLIDPNQLPFQLLTNQQSPAEAIMSAFYGSGEHPIAFSTTVYRLKDNTNTIDNIVADWKKQPRFQEMHTLSEEKLKTADSNAVTWLYVAAQNGQTEEVKAMIAAEADVNAVSLNDDTALHVATENGRVNIIKLLINADANVDATRADGATPLHIATENGNIDIIQTLLDANANINAPRADEVTPLHIAIANERLDIIRILLAHEKVNVNATYTGMTALHLAVLKNNLEIVNVLLNAKAIVNAANSDGKAPLHFAAENGQLEIVKVLLRNDNGNVNAPVIDSATPLSLAAENGHVEIIEELIKNGADINLSYFDDGATPLFIAAKRGHLDVVKTLLTNGADINAQINISVSNLHMLANKCNAENAYYINHELIKEKSDEEIVPITAIEIANIMGHRKIANLLQFQNEMKSMSQSKISTKDALFSTSKTTDEETITNEDKPKLK